VSARYRHDQGSPFPPVVLTKAYKPRLESRRRMARAASINCFHGRVGSGSRSKVKRSGYSSRSLREPQV
jgi:hypothetical protein